MTLPYAFEKLPDGMVRLNAAQAAVVQKIYQRYVDGASLGVIATELEANQITAPSGNLKWSRSVIDKILSNGKYVPYAIPMELFVAVQFEKNSRSNTQVNSEGSLQRKATRYNSQNVLSGLLVCAECGANYRRITRGLGEVVWRCANRVEYGKEICHHSPTILESEVISLICETLGLKEFEPETVHEKLEQILVYTSGALDIQLKQEQNMSFTL